MATTIHPEISPKSKYYISKERYYELKYFCLQYNDWVKLLKSFQNEAFLTHFIKIHDKDNYDISDPTSKLALKRLQLEEKIKLVESCANEVDPVLGRYIFIGVTEHKPYDYLRTKLSCPCGRELYYDRYRKFFKLLSDRKEL